MIKCVKRFTAPDFTLSRGVTYVAPADVEDEMLAQHPGHFRRVDAGELVADLPREVIEWARSR